MVAIDSDIFVVVERYQRDPRYPAARALLDVLQSHGTPRATTVFNFYEICGVLSFNLSQGQLNTFHGDFAADYDLQVLYPHLGWRLGRRSLRRLLEKAWVVLSRKVCFRDALVICTLDDHCRVSAFVTWNARHFVGKTRLNVLTPEEYLATHGDPTS
ncbi:MAG: hypothetical protein COY42_31895 [Armatimonadetes bacterium CG_4_10_14_0_8_um_filter_66_14]|nr:hypothetical protein [Armatimonadota bacterium]OIO92564.1 MAG: hypothetical protein AUJ96_32140 [Armatimonadetes bacterium CG2_30_66_41]PIZ32056.1 MAG: hypothetical protein COY42_31895 [Armatimonadetes bacterium CG_4_10_14_0_8_um_filter_66_14]PJB60553.1 MAG: hypothetical protein CO096_33365 [Armatimonadetes bacterium CG_4_9_14_3_um_filter_66_14]NCO93114.1 hypothetical protein [Armatimonadota bacterium]